MKMVKVPNVTIFSYSLFPSVYYNMPAFVLVYVIARIEKNENQCIINDFVIVHLLLVHVDALYPSQQFSVMSGRFPVFLG